MQPNELIKMYRVALCTTTELLTLSQKQLTALQQNDLTIINEVIQKQNVLLKTFTEQEKTIILEQQKLARAFGYEEYSLKQLKANLTEQEHKELEEAQNRLLEQLEELKQVNGLNNQITRQNLSYTQNMTQTISQFSNQPGNRTYSQKGQVQRDEDSSLINKRV